MKFEKVDLFCPKCGKYSVYKDPTDYECENYTERHACQSCLHTWFLGDTEHDPEVFNPKEQVKSGIDLFSKEIVEKWAEHRMKQIKEFKVIPGNRLLNGQITINLPQKFKIGTD